MTRFQKLSLLIGVLVLVLLVALITVIAFKPSSAPIIASGDLTMTYAVEWAATNAETLSAISNNAMATAAAHTNETLSSP